jgi:hypothetical protein
MNQVIGMTAQKQENVNTQAHKEFATTGVLGGFNDFQAHANQMSQLQFPHVAPPSEDVEKPHANNVVGMGIARDAATVDFEAKEPTAKVLAQPPRPPQPPKPSQPPSGTGARVVHTPQNSQAMSLLRQLSQQLDGLKLHFDTRLDKIEIEIARFEGRGGRRVQVDDDVIVKIYENGMAAQQVSSFCAEYGVSKDQYYRLLRGDIENPSEFARLEGIARSVGYEFPNNTAD